MTAPRLVLRDDAGERLTLHPDRWHSSPSAGERRLLAALDAPVLDVGCGPGRITEALAKHGVMALGVDPAPAAAALARSKGCPVLQRSVFDRLPGERRWGTVLLLDGNLGIGGDPRRLLHRCGALVRPGGSIVVEVEAPGTRSRSCRARLERNGERGPWFAWAVVGVGAIDQVASDTGLAVRSIESFEHRWIAVLQRKSARHDACA